MKFVRALLAFGGGLLALSPKLSNKILPWLKTNAVILNLISKSLAPLAPLGSEADNKSNFFDLYLSGQMRKRVVVFMPVFNAAAITKKSIEAVIANLPTWAILYIVNDASTDPKINEILGEFESHPGISIKHNAENLGYTANANAAFSAFPDDDIVLLNSDTLVTHHWLESMRYVAYCSFRVATVTAVSDDSGAFSLFDRDGKRESGVPINRLASINRLSSSGHRIEVPTGNGFCMFIRRDALNAVGFYDLEKYPRGYGEENDFSLRALRLGYKSFICDKALVSHLSGQSFGKEKVPLLEKAWARVVEDYPEYPMLIDKFNGQEFQNLRSRMQAGLALYEKDMPRMSVLYIQPIGVGGVFHANKDLRKATGSSVKSYLLASDGESARLFLHKGGEKELEQLGEWQFSSTVGFTGHSSEDYDRLIIDVIYKHSIDVVHIEHPVWQSLTFVELSHLIGVPVVASLHDFYGICPSYNLLDRSDTYCGGVCTVSQSDCNVTIWGDKPIPSLKHRYIFQWQKTFSDFFDSVDRLVAPSQSTLNIYQKIYPSISGKVEVVPHAQEMVAARPRVAPALHNRKIKLLIAGNIFTSKGDKLIAEMIKLDGNRNFEFHFLGSTSKILAGAGVHHGPYERETFVEKVESIRPDLAFFGSIWPETFNYVLSEAWAAGIVTIGLDAGAIGDRIRDSQIGAVLPLGSTALECLLFIEAKMRDDDFMSGARAKIEDWQDAQLDEPQFPKMGAAYLAIYTRLLEQKAGRP